MKCFICDQIIQHGDIIISGTELKFVGPDIFDCDFSYSDNFLFHKDCLLTIGHAKNDKLEIVDVQRSNILELIDGL